VVLAWPWWLLECLVVGVRADPGGSREERSGWSCMERGCEVRRWGVRGCRFLDTIGGME